MIRISPKAIVTVVTSFGDNLRDRMVAAGLRPAEMARMLGVAPPVVSAWFSNRRGLPEASTLFRLAKVLNVTIDELLEGIDSDYDEIREKREQARAVASEAQSAVSDSNRHDEVEIVSLDSPHTKNSIPILYEGEASPDGLSWDEDGTPRFQVEEWGSRPNDVRDPMAYLVIVRGDSMEPYIKRGYRAIVSPNLHVSDGDLVCAHLRSGERLIKEARRDKTLGGWQLQSWNPAYAARFAPDSEVAMIHRVAYVRMMK